MTCMMGMELAGALVKLYGVMAAGGSSPLSVVRHSHASFLFL